MSAKEAWDKYWEKKRTTVVHENMFERIKLMLGGLTAKRILEVGAGSGSDSLYLAKKYRSEVCCLDFSDKSLDRIKREVKLQNLECSLVKADLRHIPFLNDCFDLVFSHGVLEHFKNPLEVVLEQMRVLRKGRILGIGVPYAYTLYTVRKKILFFFKHWIPGWETQFTKSKLRDLVEKAGMRCLALYLDCHPRSYLPKRLQRTLINFMINGGVVILASKS